MKLLFLGLMSFSLVACGGAGGDADRAADPARDAGRSAGGAAAQTGGGSGGGQVPVAVAGDDSALAVTLQLDPERAARRVLSDRGGSLTATAADGSRFTLTIPPDALVGNEEIVLTPVSKMTGLPNGVTLAAGVELAPEGLLLLQPATLAIEPARAVAADQEVPFGWTREGQGVHTQFMAPRPRVPTLHITHFSGVALASGTPTAAARIGGQPAPCAGRFFTEFARLARAAREAALAGTLTPADNANLVDAFVDASRRYLDGAVKPVVKQAETDDLILPCAVNALFTWEHHARVFLGDSFDSAFGTEAAALRESIWKGVAVSFDRSYERCMRNESPLFQLARMSGAAKNLQMMGLERLLPDDHIDKIFACGRTFDYHVDVDSVMENVYREQGQGADVSSSRTQIAAKGLVARFDEQRSTQGSPVFVARSVPAEASVSMVPRHPCPDKARVAPGSTMGATVEAIVNLRVGQLRCAGGKAQCDRSDVNPGVLLHVAPHVVENTYLHTYISGKCDPVGDWNEFMMYTQGTHAIGSEEPFHVRGDRESHTVVRYGTRTRRMPVDIPPELLKMSPGMKDYVEIDTPAIQRATETTRVNIRVQRR